MVTKHTKVPVADDGSEHSDEGASDRMKALARRRNERRLP
jgi:hypothetical protein